MPRRVLKKIQNKRLFSPRSSTSLLSDRYDAALSLTQRYPKTIRYSLAVLLSVLAIIIKVGIYPVSGEGSIFLFILPSVLLSAWFGGVGPAVLAMVLTGFGVYFFFLPPYRSFALPPLRYLIELVIYFIESLLIIAIVYRRNKIHSQMQTRAAQQAIVALTGQYGLEVKDSDLLMDRVVRAIGKSLNVDHCSIFELLPDGKSFRLASGTGWKKGLVRRALISGGEDTFEGYTLQQNKPIIVANLPTERRFHASDILEGHSVVSAVNLPIAGKIQPFGILSVYTSEKRSFSKDDINFLRAMANVLATTFERKIAQEELELIASLNTELTASLNPQKSLASLGQLVVPGFSEFSEIYVRQDGDKTELHEVAANEKSKIKLLKMINDKYPPGNSLKRPLDRVLRSGRGVLQSVVEPEWEKTVAVDEKHLAMLEKLAIRSFIVVPIKLRSEVIGAITFFSTQKGRVYGPRDLNLAQEIANRAAVAIDNGRHYKEARDAIQARDEFLSIASHELKTPLTSLLLQLQSVMHSIKNDSLANFSIDRTLESLESMIGQSKRINRLINDLLNISLITTGKMKLEKERVDLREVVTDVTKRLKEQAESSGSTLSVEDGKGIIGTWDKIRLEQVVTNLVTNAIKYGNGKPIRVTLESTSNRAILIVSDQGIGIPESKQQAIFDRFKRATSAKQSIKGLGVGLYLVQQIVNAHGGTIEVKSKVNKGSIFTVTLPLRLK